MFFSKNGINQLRYWRASSLKLHYKHEIQSTCDFYREDSHIQNLDFIINTLPGLSFPIYLSKLLFQ